MLLWKENGGMTRQLPILWIYSAKNALCEGWNQILFSSAAAAAAAAADDDDDDDDEPSTDNNIDLEYMIVNIPSFSLIPLWN